MQWLCLRIETARDLERAAEKVTRAIRRGEVTPAEGQTLMHILESRSRIVERVAWEDRLAKLEAQVSTGGKLQES